MYGPVSEELLELAQKIKPRKNGLICARASNAQEIALLVLAQRFGDLPPSVRLRAIVEDWDLQNIVREVY